MTQRFDLMIVGVGMAAVSAANKCAQAGWSVAVVDERPYGGTCALRGCDPKKMLRRGAEIIDAARLMQGKGVDPAGLTIKWQELIAFQRTFTGQMPGRIEDALEGNGVSTFHGAVRFIGRDSVEVDGEAMEAEHFLVATGAEPRALSFPGAEHLTLSDQFLELEALPRRILFVGGGYVSFEFAHIAARAGSQVVIVDRGEQPLKAFDPDLVERLVARSGAAGIVLHRRANVVGIERTLRNYRVSVDMGGATQTLDADLVVHGAGRVPALKRLNLDAAEVATSEAGVVVNDYLQSTTHPAVYAAGDAAASSGIPLTPVAVVEGKVAASNLLRGNHQIPDYHGVPSVVFTIPELARIGLVEAEARAQGSDFDVHFTDTSGWYSNLRVGETVAAAKILIDRHSDGIIGAHLLGPDYAELINVFSLVMRLGLKAGDLKKMVPAYPTVGSDLGSLL